MTTLAPTTQFPEPIAFANEAAPLRTTTPLPSPREEVQLQILANEITRHAPALARRLRHHGMARLRAELIEA